MENTILQKAVILLHIGICIFLLILLGLEFEVIKAHILHFDIEISIWREDLFHILTLTIGFLYIFNRLVKRLPSKEWSLLFSMLLLICSALYTYNKMHEWNCTEFFRTKDSFTLNWILMSSLPIFLLLTTLSPLVYPLNSLDQNSLDFNSSKTSYFSESYFWRIHRIFSILLCVIAFEFCVQISYDEYDLGTISYGISILLFLISILLWFLPKWGSISLSILCTILVCSICYSFLAQSLPREIILFCIPISFLLTFVAIPFILLNKDSRKEWKMK